MRLKRSFGLSGLFRVLSAFLLLSTPAAGAEEAARPADTRGELSGSIGKGIYSKPFWRRMGRGTHVGGYVDFDYAKSESANGTFRSHRLIPFIYSDIAEGIRFATEIEFEYGGPQNNQKDGELKVEFAVLDYDVVPEHLAARGGIVLSPLGKLNLVHDTPLQDVTNRPLVDNFVIPTTLSESGVGVFGTLYPTELQKVDYEVYLVNGFNGDRTTTTQTANLTTGAVTSATTVTTGGNITSAGGLRSARGSQRSDNNNNKAVVGRIGYSPRLGYELGVSGHQGAYDAKGENDLTITAVDAAAQFGPLELLGEAAQADIDRGAGVSLTAVPGALRGWYGQANLHFLQDKVRPGSTFTAVLRYDEYDTDLTSRQTRETYGLNFRPVEDAVFVVDYAVNHENPRSDNDTLSLSFASYF
jgi:hypothetical protein